MQLFKIETGESYMRQIRWYVAPDLASLMKKLGHKTDIRRVDTVSLLVEVIDATGAEVSELLLRTSQSSRLVP